MRTHQHLITMPFPSTGAGASRGVRAKALALRSIETLSGMAKDALFAYAMTGSAVASLAIIATPHLEMLLRCVFHGRG